LEDDSKGNNQLLWHSPFTKISLHAPWRRKDGHNDIHFVEEKTEQQEVK
jgi:hypothetical protein